MSAPAPLESAPSRTLPLALCALVVTGSLARFAFVYASLPEVVASHFDGSGTPNGFQARSAFALLSVAVELFMFVTFAGLPRLMRVMPVGLINMPHREYWLAPERKEASVARLAGFLDWFSLATMVLLASTFELVLQANLARTPLANGPMWGLLALYFAFSIAWLVALWRAFRAPASA